MNFSSVESWIRRLQEKITSDLARIGSESGWARDSWCAEGVGEGTTCIIENGKTFERAAVNMSSVSGSSLPASASARKPELEGCPFQATGLSVIVHPYNPYVPTTHFNLRFFTATRQQGRPAWWFGGGFDLTPYYGFEEDCRHWHQTAADACSPFGSDIYPEFKRWCDDYFFLKHRNEARGIGGLFFDDYNAGGDFDAAWGLVRSIGNHFIPAYLPIVERHIDQPWGDTERHFQLWRRGRYVEFNLVYDRGTLFGLQSSGRIESILASLPPTVEWRYNFTPSPGSVEAQFYERFLRPRNWLE